MPKAVLKEAFHERLGQSGPCWREPHLYCACSALCIAHVCMHTHTQTHTHTPQTRKKPRLLLHSSNYVLTFSMCVYIYTHIKIYVHIYTHTEIYLSIDMYLYI